MGYDLTKDEKIIQKRREVDFSVEFRLLKAIYNNPDLLDDPSINRDLFDSSSTAHIYDALKNLKDKSISFSKNSLLQEYSILDLNASESVIDVISSTKDVEIVTNPKDIVDHLKDYGKRREAKAILKKAQNLIDSTPRITNELNESVRDLTIKAEDLLTVSSDEDDANRVMTIKEWCDMHRQSFTQRRQGKQYYFRNYLFDDLLEDGPCPGEIGLIASATGSGKSTVCENLVDKLMEFEIPCMYFSLEMGAIPMMDRLLSMRTGIPYKELKNPEENFENIQKIIEEEYEKLASNELAMFSQTPDLTISRLEEEIRKFQKKTGKKYLIAIIDLLSMMPDFAQFFQGATVATGIEFQLNKLNSVAKRLGVHIIGTLQITSKSMEANANVNCIEDLQKLRPNRGQVKNAQGWLERARYTIITFRPRMYAELYLTPEEYETMDDVIELTLSKVNNDEVGKVTKGLFVGKCFKIEPLIEDEIVKQNSEDVFRD